MTGIVAAIRATDLVPVSAAMIVGLSAIAGLALLDPRVRRHLLRRRDET